MRPIGRRAIACTASLCATLAACGGGGSGGGLLPSGNGLTPFPTQQIDQLPPGPRVDVSSKNLFQMSSGDNWQFTVLDGSGNPTGSTAMRQVTADDGAGHVSLTDFDGGASTTNYTVSADGLLDTAPLGTSPASMASIVGSIFEYATPLYPVGAERKHVRSGPYGQDLDGDGKDESFLFEYTQVFLGFETVQLSNLVTLSDVAHFHNVLQLTLRPTGPGNTDYTVTATEDAWFAPDLGMVKAQRTAVDSDGVTLEPPHTILFRQGFVAGVSWDVSVPPPPPPDGSVLDVPLKHNALVYDGLRNVYYASVPGSAGNGNSIATIDPAGHVSYSAPVGSEPNALAIAADSSVLYVGLDGTSELAMLALPNMNELKRTKLANPSDPARPAYAETIAVSPVDASVVGVAMAYPGSSPRHAGVALLRNMVMQPNLTQAGSGSNLITFDSNGTKAYGLNTETTEFGLRRIQVLADGLAEELVVAAETDFGTRALSFSSGQVVAGNAVLSAPALDRAGTISSPSSGAAIDCRPQRSGIWLMCFDTPGFNNGTARILLVNPGTFVIGASLVYTRSEPGNRRSLVEGQAGQVAISYPLAFGVSKIRLFTSALLSAPPAPPAPSWPITASSTPDGQALDVGILHNSLVYDAARNVYYASVPGSVIGAGNSIAVIDPATGQVTHSAPVGSEPAALALAADASVLYVALNGSGEIVRLALPSMAEQGRVRLPAPGQPVLLQQSRAMTIAVSPADATVAAVAIGQNLGSALIRDMVVQPNRTSFSTFFGLNSTLVFDSAGSTLFGFDNGTVRKIDVLADGLSEQASATVPNVISASIGLVNGLVITAGTAFDASTLAVAGTVTGAADCRVQRGGALLLCLAPADYNTGEGRILVASSSTFASTSSILFSTTEALGLNRQLVQGPAGQAAVSYTASFSAQRKVRLFSSAQLP